MRITISDIAREVGVSTTTVSRYLNKNYDYMSYETRQRIEQVIEKYNYVPSNAARILKSKHSKNIGVVVNTLRYQVAAQTLTGINEICAGNGYSTVIYTTDDDPEKESKALQKCINQQVDGIVLIPCQNIVQPYLNITNYGIPIVMCTRRFEAWPYSSVSVKHDEIINNMVLHLVEQGFEKVQFLLDEPNFHKRWMADIFADLAKKYFNMSPCDSVVFVGRQNPNIGENIDAFLSKYQTNHKAIMAVNTQTLFLLLKEIEKRKLVMPNDVGICGYDALGWSELVYPGITIMRQPMKETGRKAGEELVRCLKLNTLGDRKIRLAGENFYRGSTRLKGV